MKNSIVCLLVAVASAFCTITTHAQCPSEGWSTESVLPIPLQEIACVAWGDRIYVLGDNNCNGQIHKFHVYDVSTDQWGELADIPTPRSQAAVAVANGIIYQFGGNSSCSNSWHDTVDAYDTNTDQWIANLPSLEGINRGLLTAAAVDGRIYVQGGTNSYVVPTCSYNHIFDPQTSEWDLNAPDLPRPRSHHAAAVLGKKIYLVGGLYRLEHNADELIPEVDVFDTETETWSQAAPLPTPRHGLSAIAVAGRIYAIGGNYLDSPDVLDIVEEYDPRLNCWRTVTPIPLPRFRGGAAEVDYKIHYIAGNDGSGSVTTHYAGVPVEIESSLFCDVNGDGTCDEHDLQFLRALLPPCFSADVNGDGVVDVFDLLMVLSAWGACNGD